MKENVFLICILMISLLDLFSNLYLIYNLQIAKYEQENDSYWRYK